MRPLTGNIVPNKTQTESASPNKEIKEGLFRAATNVSNLLQSFAEQIGGRASALGGPSANAANFSSSAAATVNTTPLLQA